MDDKQKLSNNTNLMGNIQNDSELTGTLSVEGELTGSLNFGRGDAGLSAFEEWKLIEGNEDKTFDDFLKELGGTDLKNMVNYNRPYPTTNSVGGVQEGTIFKGTVQNALDKLFYPEGFPEVAGLKTEKGIMLLSEDDEILENSEHGVMISELPETSEARGFIPIVQDGETMKIEAQLLDSYTNPVSDTITDYRSALDYLLYYDLVINLQVNKATTVEVGTIISDVVFTWNYNKNIVSQKFNGVQLENDVRTYLLEDSVIYDRTFTIAARDERKEFSKSITFNFRHGRYWGTSSLLSLTSDDILRGLNKELSTSRGKTFTVNANEGEYIYYCYPASWGQGTFSVGGFVGGFELIETINFLNVNNIITSYYIYRSANKSLGNTTVVIS